MYDNVYYAAGMWPSAMVAYKLWWGYDKRRDALRAFGKNNSSVMAISLFLQWYMSLFSNGSAVMYYRQYSRHMAVEHV
jgi:hypothetical protein